ncbi:type VI secretion system amidase effector protein Tae4 [Niveibacterium sp. SC-1]|uniref:type VI secretion system amidase effector protein Tae4 n=1 Tax=Niveibacterium sp. SC-1 TaxID=3135646 RepID=UPI00311DAEF9
MARPSFSSLWAASQVILAGPGEQQAQKVAKIIGGTVARNINAPANAWENTCAVRMSYILGHCGVLIPAIAGRTVTGADRRNYFFRVPYLIEFLRHAWGKPEVIAYPASSAALQGRRGVVLFEVTGWGDARGHATLFDGKSCYDHCYFNEPGVTYRTDRANLWTVP